MDELVLEFLAKRGYIGSLHHFEQDANGEEMTKRIAEFESYLCAHPPVPDQVQFDAEQFEPPFNPMEWMANVNSLGTISDQPIGGSLQGVVTTMESFQKSVVDKMAFMPGDTCWFKSLF